MVTLISSHSKYYVLCSTRYSVGADLFDYNLPENACFCSDDPGCPVSGVANVSKCQLNAPAAISMPHFLYADKTYRQLVTGLKPDPTKHAFNMDVFTVIRT